MDPEKNTTLTISVLTRTSAYRLKSSMIWDKHIPSNRGSDQVLHFINLPRKHRQQELKNFFEKNLSNFTHGKDLSENRNVASDWQTDNAQQAQWSQELSITRRSAGPVKIKMASHNTTDATQYSLQIPTSGTKPHLPTPWQQIICHATSPSTHHIIIYNFNNINTTMHKEHRQ